MIELIEEMAKVGRVRIECWPGGMWYCEVFATEVVDSVVQVQAHSAELAVGRAYVMFDQWARMRGRAA